MLQATSVPALVPHCEKPRRVQLVAGACAMGSLLSGIITAPSRTISMEDQVFGQNDYRYRYVPGWPKLPEGRVMGDVAGVAVNARGRGNVYLFSRTAHSISVFDPAGNYLRGWGEGVFERPHAMHVGLDEALYCTDGRHGLLRPQILIGWQAASDAWHARKAKALSVRRSFLPLLPHCAGAEWRHLWRMDTAMRASTAFHRTADC